MLKYLMKQKRILSADEKKHIIGRITSVLQAKEYILFAYIFGSFTSAKSFNDIDVGIFISANKPESLLVLELEMERELEDILHIPVDIRIINNAPLSFIYNVLKGGIVILDNDKSLRTDFEGLICKKYFDYKHLRNEYLRGIVNASV